jgi:hypothetical protein
MRKLSLVFFLAFAGILSSSSNAKSDSIKVMSRASCSGDGLVFRQDVGHSAIAFYDGSGKLLGTRAMWPGGVRTNDQDDMKMAKGEGCGLRTRTANVSSSRRNWAWNQVSTTGGTNCQTYTIIGKIQGRDDYCSCVNFSTRVWRQVTSDWERWQFQTTPKLLGDTIQSANGGNTNGIFDKGRVWK